MSIQPARPTTTAGFRCPHFVSGVAERGSLIPHPGTEGYLSELIAQAPGLRSGLFRPPTSIQTQLAIKPADCDYQIRWAASLPPQIQQAVYGNPQVMNAAGNYLTGGQLTGTLLIEELRHGGSEKLVFFIHCPETQLTAIGKAPKGDWIRNLHLIPKYQNRINSIDPNIYPHILAHSDNLIVEEYIHGVTFNKLVEHLESEALRPYADDFVKLWLHLWQVGNRDISLDAKLSNVIVTRRGMRIIDISGYRGETSSFGLLWHLSNHISDCHYYSDRLLKACCNYYGDKSRDFFESLIGEETQTSPSRVSIMTNEQLLLKSVQHDNSRRFFRHELTLGDVVKFYIINFRQNLQIF